MLSLSDHRGTPWNHEFDEFLNLMRTHCCCVKICRTIHPRAMECLDPTFTQTIIWGHIFETPTREILVRFNLTFLPSELTDIIVDIWRAAELAELFDFMALKSKFFRSKACRLTVCPDDGIHYPNIRLTRLLVTHNSNPLVGEYK